MKTKFISIIKSSNDSENIGDDIIFELGKESIFKKYENDYLFYTSQKMPTDIISLRYQKQSNIQLLYGTNALVTNYRPSFLRVYGVKFGFWKSRKIKNKVVLMGVGSDGGKKISLLQKILYKRILSKTKIHSVRDEHTKILLEKIGFKNVINTSCPTTWNLAAFKNQEPNLNSSIILSFSLFNDDPKFVKRLCKEAASKYKKTYVWVQTWGELTKIRKLVKDIDNINIINPNLNSLKKIASKTNTFYIGTRLHAGIYNLNFQNPSVIIQIDQRAHGIHKISGIPIIKYENNLSLKKIETKFKDVANINIDNIKNKIKKFIND